MIYSLTAQVESDFIFSTKCWKREILIYNPEAWTKVVTWFLHFVPDGIP